MNCEVTNTDGYRETMFNMLSQLKYLDNADREGGEYRSEDVWSGIERVCLVEKDSDDEDDEDEEENGGQ